MVGHILGLPGATMFPGDNINRYLDDHIRPEVRVFRRSWPAFQVFGSTGLGLAVVLAMMLVTHQGLSPLVMSSIVLVAVSILFGLTLLTKVVTGEERITNYHHQVAVLVVVATVLRITGQPVLPYLDATMLGVGLFIACSRIGCLLAGCCHGRPYRWGVCYGKHHANAAVTPHLAGVRLVPIQVIESMWILCAVVAGSFLVLTNYPPGVALAWYIVLYAMGRFYFEFLRGDPERPYFWGFSEAQWTSLAILSVTGWAEISGLPSFHGWHLAATITVAITMLVIAVNRRFCATVPYQLLLPRHVQEVAEAAGGAAHPIAEGAAPSIRSTSLGVQISAGAIQVGDGLVNLYSLSLERQTMTTETARALADVIIELRHFSAQSELVTQNRGVFHLVIYPAAEASQL